MSDALVITPWSHPSIVDQLHRLGRRVGHQVSLCFEDRFVAYLAALFYSLRHEKPSDYPPTKHQTNRAEQLSEMAQQFLERGELSDALAAALRALSNVPHSPHLHVMAGRATSRLGAVEPAGRFFFQALWLDGDSLDARLELDQLPVSLNQRLYLEVFGPPI